ncbi:MAG: phosphatidyl-myo-inositol dimannoside synthase [Mycobacteriales bacterium]
MVAGATGGVTQPLDGIAVPQTVVVTGHFPPEPGGVQTFTWELVRRLPADRVLVVAPYRRGAAAFDRSLPFPVLRRRGYLLTRDLRRLVDDAGASTGWITALAPVGLYAPLLRAAGLTRVVASTHGQELGWLRVGPTREAIRRMARVLDGLTYLTHYTRQRLETAIDRPEILSQLAGGVDVDLFRPDPVVPRPRPGGGRPVVVSVSRLVRRKGHDVLLRAWPQVLAAVPGARLVIVGVGPMAGRLAQAAAAPRLRGSVRLTGYLPRAEVAARLAAADVFVLPCRDHRAGLQTEGLGLAVLEASAAGLPVVVGRSGGSVDSVVDGHTGLLTRAEDPAELAAHLTALLRDPERARRMGEAGRRWVHANWTWARSARRLAGVLAGPAGGDSPAAAAASRPTRSRC